MRSGWRAWSPPWRHAALVDRAHGLGRSLWIYYGSPRRVTRLRRFYAQFVREGDLCFDLGAHVGSRSRCWSALGARVVAVEPQPDCVAFLRLLFARDRNVTLVAAAVAATAGTLTLRVAPRTPTVTTGSSSFIAEASRAPSFAWVRWQRTLEVPALTLDQLVARFGEPAFVKIDVEGMEHEVLRGSSRALPCLSFEFVPASLGSALASLERLQALGRYRFNVAMGEDACLAFATWLDAAALRRWLEARPVDSGSGDVYARLARQPQEIAVADGEP